MNVSGLIILIAFYVIVFAVALWARKFTRDTSQIEIVLAGKRLGFVVGTLTVTASLIGPTTWSGAAEIMFLRGLIWTQAPFCYSLSLLIGGAFLVGQIRKTETVTIIDLFQNKYGKYVGGIYMIPVFLTELIGLSAIINALGTAVAPLLNIPTVFSVIFSSIFVGIYTSIGSMYAVAYTDIVQLVLMITGIVLCVPFVAYNDAMDEEKVHNDEYLGDLQNSDIWLWIDVGLSLICGLITAQAFYQRVVAVKSTTVAKYVCFTSAVTNLALSTPAMLIGYYARVIDWEKVDSFNSTISRQDAGRILPLTLSYLVPQWVSLFSLAALSAASMSSADSVILSSASAMAINFYKHLLRSKASENEVVWVIRICCITIPIIPVIISIYAPTVYYLSVLGKDFKYVILFPHLMIQLFWTGEHNSYGALSSLFFGCLLRLLGGAPTLNIPAFIQYPGYDVKKGQLFPHRTFTMLLVFAIHISVSWIAKYLFSRQILGEKYDILKVFSNATEPTRNREDELQAENLLLENNVR